MVDEIGYFIHFLVEKCDHIEEWFDFLIMFAIMIIIGVLLLTGLVFVGSFRIINHIIINIFMLCLGC